MGAQGMLGAYSSFVWGQYSVGIDFKLKSLEECLTGWSGAGATV